MATRPDLPDDWDCTFERTDYDPTVAREYTKIGYEHEEGEQNLWINDVQQPKRFVGWRYQIRATGSKSTTIDYVEDLETAKAVALEFMTEYDSEDGIA